MVSGRETRNSTHTKTVFALWSKNSKLYVPKSDTTLVLGTRQMRKYFLKVREIESELVLLHQQDSEKQAVKYLS